MNNKNPKGRPKKGLPPKLNMTAFEVAKTIFDRAIASIPVKPRPRRKPKKPA